MPITAVVAVVTNLRHLPRLVRRHSISHDDEPSKPVTATENGGDWRERKKTATRDRLRNCALGLFREQGYEATTVEQIAAAEASHT